DGAQARLFIEQINYSLLLFDKQLPDATATELESFTRSLPQRHSTPLIIQASGNGAALTIAIRKKLS
ncbi:MAG TPA: hypothetical protein VGC64_04550, partial [Pyrinomonadaceae bacterium]